MPNNGVLQSIDFDALLPLLVSAYKRGQLVPFIGAGMSAPTLSLWQQFVSNLEREAGISVPSHPSLEVRAQKATTRIRNTAGHSCFLKSLAQALMGDGFDSGLPPQTEALASIYWPLVISTNYDDLLYSAFRGTAEGKLQPEVLGRSPADCKRILSSLGSPFDRELIWHIQGFLGGQCPECDTTQSIEPDRLDRLRNELVVGHSEYRSVTNTAVQFRRCFGEVFRSRSFLFLGSSLSEDYFLNLFGEILELCGPSSVPHFAFAPGEKVDRQFLAEQMNILVCEYDDPVQVRHWLQEFQQELERPAARASGWSFDIETPCDLEIVARTQKRPPGPSDATAWVVRRAEDESVDGSAFRQGRGEVESKFSGLMFPAGGRVLRGNHPGFYAVTARDSSSMPEGETDSVFSAGTELLQFVSQDGFQCLHLHMPSGGGSVPPVYGFIETMRTFGHWKRDGGSLKLVLHVGSQVMLNLTSQQIDIPELLTSNLTRFWVLVYADSNREPLRRVLYYPAAETCLLQVLEDVGVPPQHDWLVSLSPSPLHDEATRKAHRTTAHLSQKTLLEIGVGFGSVLTLERATIAECVAGAASGG